MTFVKLCDIVRLWTIDPEYIRPSEVDCFCLSAGKQIGMSKFNFGATAGRGVYYGCMGN